ncbi:LytTR family transcriptional regulator DNA-binding domain-containing protein [Flammeovirga yaeyamensis]|uniref:LytTR family transcriptional regulator DNA-binding domain-containing protein n=1 Tax=Flammeovirga yaeyamensis TaxID=367791 RepID=A0AAX1NA50_9BACT|nr:LytTR family DNA-binding domain-containing protein [Flammeovirga yaeyamensis]MBB3697441.1 DNA-binding LytR/AlgR family response regulator [Flammeovirga yaeyamensis]NMF36135.1 response regulator transcription factor [Flammeovirga yaeyamensis]QWG02868.1 LytTR family transcriptional regulator DNA-binding domain-containing protein [Flammeovirga yaeyamensis]
MKYLIIEDEMYNAEMLELMVQTLRPDWQLVDKIDKVSTAIEWFSNQPNACDVIFMDIQLKDGISFSIFDKTQINQPIIFTTAFNQYAIQAFEVNSVDYLLKPIDENKLSKAIEKLEATITPSKSEDIDYQLILSAIQGEKKEYRKRFLIQGTQAYYKLDVNEIAYLKSESNITTAVLFSGKEYILNHTMESLESQLDPKDFFRVNRSCIVSIQSIKSFENHFGGKLAVFLTTNEQPEIMISRLKANTFKMWIDQ